jgi:hypothetical protein
VFTSLITLQVSTGSNLTKISWENDTAQAIIERWKERKKIPVYFASPSLLSPTCITWEVDLRLSLATATLNGHLLACWTSVSSFIQSALPSQVVDTGEILQLSGPEYSAYHRCSSNVS